jgi:hypothetical protein
MRLEGWPQLRVSRPSIETLRSARKCAPESAAPQHQEPRIASKHMAIWVGELLQRCDVTANERLLLGATLSLELSFAFDGIGDAIEPFRKDQFYRPARLGISFERSSIVPGNSCL